ncbi:hypothetical protein ACVWYQ_003498 [Bradyrhizobium sp. USDA 3397]
MIRRSASTSTPASTMTRRPPASSISTRRSVEWAVVLSDDADTDATGPSSATTALTKPASDLLRFFARALRQVTSRERDRPYRRAVAATRRGSDRLSRTIRVFSSSDQRRRRPVSTTSSRFSALIVWLSIRTVLNHQAGPPQGVCPRRLTISFGQSRVLVVWTDIILPNGATLQIGGMAGTDPEGYGGFNDEVDNHYFQVFGSAILIATLGAGNDMSMPASSPYGYQLTPTDAPRNSFAESFGRVAEQTIRKNMNVQRTLEIRPAMCSNSCRSGPYLYRCVL